MATRDFTVFLPIDHNGNTIMGAIGIIWTGLLNGDDGKPYVCPHRSDKCVQFKGTFGAGGTIILEGTNDQVFDTLGALQSVTYAQLTDPQGNNISKTAAAIEQVLENPNAIRPRVTAGDGTTALTCTAIISSTARL
jgi:hypothetical protein